METSEMIRHILLSAAEVPAETAAAPRPSAVLGVYLFGGAGVLLLLGWLIRTWGRNPLARCPVRRHRLPVWFVPSQILIWMVGYFLLLLIVQAVYKDIESWQYQLAANGVLIIWYTILLILFIAVARFGFARGLRGFGLRWRWTGRDLIFAVLTLTALMPLIYGALIGIYQIGKLFNPDFMIQQHASLEALAEFPQWWMRAVIIFNAVLVVPLFEEVLFRGLLQSTLTAQLRSPWLSILSTSILFAILHPYPAHLVPLFILSVGLGYAYEKSGSLLRPIFIHILFNGLSITFALLGI